MIFEHYRQPMHSRREASKNGFHARVVAEAIWTTAPIEPSTASKNMTGNAQNGFCFRLCTQTILLALFTVETFSHCPRLSAYFRFSPSGALWRK
jgi:hypothetical protein